MDLCEWPHSLGSKPSSIAFCRESPDRPTIFCGHFATYPRQSPRRRLRPAPSSLGFWSRPFGAAGEPHPPPAAEPPPVSAAETAPAAQGEPRAAEGILDAACQLHITSPCSPSFAEVKCMARAHQGIKYKPLFKRGPVGQRATRASSTDFGF